VYIYITHTYSSARGSYGRRKHKSSTVPENMYMYLYTNEYIYIHNCIHIYTQTHTHTYPSAGLIGEEKT